ncbi:MAG: hypothetical protein ACI93B_001385 [Yoonia sp.]|jgi:hypothetical protein
MISLSLVLLTSIALAALLAAFFVHRAWKSGNWGRPTDMLAEFVAVFLAIAIGIWISGIERETERKEEAEALLIASTLYVSGIVDVLFSDQMVLTEPTLLQPNILQTFGTSSSAARIFSNEHFKIIQLYQDFVLADRPEAEECNADIHLFELHSLDASGSDLATRWIRQLNDFPASSPSNQSEMSEDEIRETLTNTQRCVKTRFYHRALAALDLYEALCIASLLYELEPSCNWDLVSSDAKSRAEFDSLRLEDPFDFPSHLTSRFSGAMAQNKVAIRQQEIIEALLNRVPGSFWNDF